MKSIFLTLFLSLLAIGTYAQDSVNLSEMPNLVVVKKEWRFEVRNPALDSPLLAAEEHAQQEQDIRNTNAENRRRASTGLPPIKPPVRLPGKIKDGPPSANYVYEVKIKNTGEKSIKTLTLGYVFFDLTTKQEVGRRHFVSNQGLSAGKTKNLVFRSAAPPTGTINANDSGKKSRDQYIEQVIIQSLEYADGSSWQAPLKNQ
jgi:hypothetical protein